MTTITDNIMTQTLMGKPILTIDGVVQIQRPTNNRHDPRNKGMLLEDWMMDIAVKAHNEYPSFVIPYCPIDMVERLHR